MSTTRFTLSATAAVALGAALALGAPLGASAHVTFEENTAAAGSYALLTFKVPNESATAATTSITVSLPTDTPLVSVRTVPVPGWEALVVTSTLPEPVKIGETTITEAPTSIVWTATGEGLGGTQLGLFPFSIGPVPEVGRLELPVDQGYSDGSVVTWDGEDVPTLFVNDEPTGGHHGGGAHGEAPAAGDHDGEAAHDDAAHDDAGTPDGTALAGLITGTAGLLLGGTALAIALIRRRADA